MEDDEWQTSCVEMKQRGKKLFESGQWSDCTILVGESQVIFSAHRLILAMASPVFEALLFSSEANESIKITDITPEGFSIVLNYVYTEDIKIQSYESAQEVYRFANKFLLLQLAKVCITYMLCNLTPQNMCYALQTALVADEQELVKSCTQQMKWVISDVLLDKSFEEVDLGTVVKIFSIPDLHIDSEEELFSALERYCESSARPWKRKPVQNYNLDSQRGVKPNNDQDFHNYALVQYHFEMDEKDKASVRPALEQIRFLTLTAEQTGVLLARSPLLSREDMLGVLANTASRRTRVPMPHGFTTDRDPRWPQRPTPRQVEENSEATFRWSVQASGRLSAQSGPFAAGGVPWTLKLHPLYEFSTSDRQTPTNLYIGFFLKCERVEPPPWSCHAVGEFRLLTHSPGKAARVLKLDNKFTSECRDWGYARFISLSDALYPENGFVDGNKLTIEVRVVAKVTTSGPALTRSGVSN